MDKIDILQAKIAAVKLSVNSEGIYKIPSVWDDLYEYRLKLKQELSVEILRVERDNKLKKLGI